ncbi:M15 family metallopeptidase [Tenacibaculum maritimum]|uniref:M15 family metallopeptidase n=1 Tax=Tenacibaculum maritimum TaxID=107401 RepID=UPI000466EE90|nr:M15 family metallopeptidase [Tenacibaculum maritimum]
MKQFILHILLLTSLSVATQNLPNGFVYLKDIAPSIKSDVRYCSHNNFIGTPIDGYENNIVITTLPTAKALQKVQKKLLSKGLSLKIFDAYRPQRAVNHFVAWAKVLKDTVMKQQYYPKIHKKHLFKLGYIASKSGHTRGSTVDLTIVNLKTGKELDMGSPYDFFGPISHVLSKQLTPKQHTNRFLLRKRMLEENFKPYKNEWWHFTLRNEPFPKTYFNFPVKL